MRKNLLYTGVLLLFATAFLGLILNYKKKQRQRADFTLQPRNGKLATTDEWKGIQLQYNAISKELETNPDNEKRLLELASLYINEGRITGNNSYYDAAAMQLVNQVLNKTPDHFDALNYKALLLLSQHHFGEALAVAKKAQNIFSYNAFLYGTITDSQVELGQYAAAVVSADSMIAIRPDLRSYSRVAYLREIHGDTTGAIAAMKLAVDAGLPGNEATEWCRVQLGKLYEQTGNLSYASMHYTIALEKRPYYAPAYAGLARIAFAKNETTQAIILLQQADSLLSDLTLKEEMAAIYLATGNKQAHQQLYTNIINKMEDAAALSAKADSAGHYSDKEMSYAYAALNQLDKALFHAIQEYNRRPDNIDVNENMAWVYFKRGENTKAVTHLEKALVTGNKNPLLLCRAVLIYAAAGNKFKAQYYASKVLPLNYTPIAGLKKACEQAIQ
ncbi:MAG: transposase [Sphingobacteriales bacterium]|nr:MAG: transposase [Sphingobacteriales bacterium]